MMKIAFFSDIHANLPALHAVLVDIDQQKPDLVFCLGDLVGYNIWPNEVVNAIKGRMIPTIMGNHDEALLSADIEEKSNRGITKRLTSQENQDYLTLLPRELSMSFRMGDGKVSFLMVHGSVKGIDDYLTENYPEEEVLQMMEPTNTDVLLCGHTHKPYHRMLNTKGGFKHIVNIGSVGKPKDGDQRACYVMLSFGESLSNLYPSSLKVDFRRIGYDVEKAALAVERSDFPGDYGKALREAN